MSEAGQNKTPRSRVDGIRIKPLAVVAGFFIILLIIVNRDSHPGKSLKQIQYESWLNETEQKTRTSVNNETLPNLSLIVIPFERDRTPMEKVINANNISHARDKILRLLQLINESGLNRFQTEKPSADPGNIILKIQGEDKSFTLNFQPSDVEENVKAALMLKLFDEYMKDQIPENLAKQQADDEMARIKEDISRIMEGAEIAP